MGLIFFIRCLWGVLVVVFMNVREEGGVVIFRGLLVEFIVLVNIDILMFNWYGIVCYYFVIYFIFVFFYRVMLINIFLDLNL